MFKHKEEKLEDTIEAIEGGCYYAYMHLQDANQVLSQVCDKKAIVEAKLLNLEEYISDMDSTEANVFLLVFRDGKTNREIAEELHYSLRQVKYYRASARNKVELWSKRKKRKKAKK